MEEEEEQQQQQQQQQQQAEVEVPLPPWSSLYLLTSRSSNSKKFSTR